MKKYILIPVVLVFLIVYEVSSQTIATQKYRLSEGSRPLNSFLDSLERQQPIRFFYLQDWIEPLQIESPEAGDYTLGEILSSALAHTDLQFVMINAYAVIFYKDPARDMAREDVIRRALRDNKGVEKRVLGQVKQYTPGKKLTLHGTVYDEYTRAPLTGVSVYVNELETGVTTDANGAYSITLPGGKYLLTLRSINYDEKLVDLTIYTSGQMNIDMKEEPVTLSEVVVSDQYIVNKRVGQTSISTVELRRTPSFLGQPDIIKQIQLQAGVTTASEATSGFNVRGGGVDQNLVLYDGTTVFNTTHALGFFTSFNSDVIKETSFYKGGIPAEYGGRVSSVLSITSKEGAYDKWHAGGSVGFVSSSLYAEGPIKRDTSSLVISARTTYSDWVLNTLKTRFQSMQDGSVFFYDGSIKYTQKLDKQSKITFSGYTSRDRFQLSNDTTYNWQNLALSLRYDHTTRNNLLYSVALSMGHYDYLVRDDDAPTAFDLRYAINYPSLKIDFMRSQGVHKQSFGFQSTYYNFNPGMLEATSPESSAKSEKMKHEYAMETSVYFSESFHVSDQLTVEPGLRVTLFSRFGPGTVYNYASDAPREPRSTVDSTTYSGFNIMKAYVGPEPRLTAQYTIDTKSSLKFGYNHMYQYVHLISNTSSITPVDIWQSSNTYFKPQRSDQVSLGYFRSGKNGMYEISVEGFYKWLNQLLDFKDGANLILNDRLETALLSGRGKAYGGEFSITKLSGDLTGSINYTYSRSLRQIPGSITEDGINEGKWYPSNFDQPHIVNVTWRYGIVRRLFFSGTFTYHTGRPISLPIGGYVLDGVPVSEISERNNYRVPDYHRLDLAFVLEPNYRKKKVVASTWTLSFYNVYGRKNPYSVFFMDQGGGFMKAYQLSLIGTIVPSLTYSFKF